VAEAQTRVHEHPDEIPAEAWSALVAQPPASVTGSREWIDAALATVDRGCSPYLAAFYCGDRLIGLLTLVRDGEPGRGETLRFAASPFNDLADVLALPGHEEIVARAAMTFLTHSAGEGWRIHLSDLDPDGLLARRRDSGLRWDEASAAPVVDLRRPSAGLSPPRRRRLARKLDRLREGHRVTFRCTSGDGMLDEMEAFISMRETRLRQLSRTLDDPPLDFLREAVRRLAPTGRCAFLELLVDDYTVARDLHLLDRGVAMLWLRALDMGWLRPPCGLLLLGESMRWLHSEGFTTLDFGRGNEPYKFEWGGQPRQLLSVTASDNRTPATPQSNRRKPGQITLDQSRVRCLCLSYPLRVTHATQPTP
jgi:CelD/BcsL family acetyltransferase involved in cellulose biosynthesis